MKKLREHYTGGLVVDYDTDARKFKDFLESYFSKKYLGSDVMVFEDDGSIKAPSGYYMEIRGDQFYISPADIFKAWLGFTGTTLRE